MDKRAIGKGPDKLNTQTKYHWTSMDFSFAKITIMARRKIYTAIESFCILLNEIPIYQIMSQKSCSIKQKTEKAIKRWLFWIENEIQ